MICPRSIRQLGADQAGATLVEFALIAPVMLGLLLGVFDLGFNIYTRTQLEGAVQKAARDATIEGAAGRQDYLDGKVSRAVKLVTPNAEVSFSRRAYNSFSDVGRPEDYTDVNANGICDAGEPFEDANGTGEWENDSGSAGLGGARDAVLYTVSVSWPRAFPVGGLLGLPDTQTTRSTTVLRNQPYGEQPTPQVLNCE